MSIYVMSDTPNYFIKELKNLNYNVVSSDTISELLEPEQKHSDMQVLKIYNKIFILNECKKLINFLIDRTDIDSKDMIVIQRKIGNRYPENILLNFLLLNKTLYGKLSAIPPQVYDYCIKNNIKLVNVNQGYSRCSTLIISENAVITADNSIEKALKNNGVDVLKISSGNIKLQGFEYGFIGGASGQIDNNIIFFGDVTKHPNFQQIKNFCKKYNKDIKIIGKNHPLTDIGGIVTLAN